VRHAISIGDHILITNNGIHAKAKVWSITKAPQVRKEGQCIHLSYCMYTTTSKVSPLDDDLVVNNFFLDK